MGFNRHFQRRAKRQRERVRDFDDTLAFIDRVEERSRARMAQTGEKPRRVLIGVDRQNLEIEVVPADPPPPPQRQEGDG